MPSSPIATSEISQIATGAAVSFAAEMADLTAWFLSQTGVSFSADRPISLPGWYLLEMGAAMQIHVWERQGVWHEGLGLPSFQEANTAIAERAADCKDEDTPILTKVLKVWLTRFTWTRPTATRSPFAISCNDADEDEFVDRMARLLLDQVRGKTSARIL